MQRIESRGGLYIKAVVVELVVVILGVFIGLQAANWNENRKTDERAADFTQRLRADLREEAWSYE